MAKKTKGAHLKKHWAHGLGKAAVKAFKRVPPPPAKNGKKNDPVAVGGQMGGADTKRKRKRGNAIMPYKADQRILLVGEGNFSFAASLASLLGSATELTATSFDYEETVKKKYLDAATEMETVTDFGGKVVHGVDATKLHENTELESPYDRIVFNFPHIGMGIKDKVKNIAANQLLISEFLRNSKTILDPDGEIHITIKRGEPYDEWKVVKVGLEVEGLRLKNAFDFDSSLYPDYRHRRTLGHVEGVSTDANEDIAAGAKTYIFALKVGHDDNEIDEPQRKPKRGKHNAGEKRRINSRKGRREREGAPAVLIP